MSETHFVKIQEDLAVAKDIIEQQSANPIFCETCINILVHLSLKSKEIKQDEENQKLFYNFITAITYEFGDFKIEDPIPIKIWILQVKKNNLFILWFLKYYRQLNQIDYQTRLRFLEEQLRVKTVVQ